VNLVSKIHVRDRGRPKKLDSALNEKARKLYIEDWKPIDFVIEDLGISRATFFRYRQTWKVDLLRVGIIDEYDVPTRSYLRNERLWDKSLLGYDLKLIRKIVPSLGYQLRLVPMKFKELLPGLASDKLDIVFASLGKTEVREKLVSFSDSYRPNGGPDFHLTHRPGFSFTSGTRLAVVQDSIPQDYAKKFLPPGLRFLPCNSYETCFNLLKQNQVDCAFAAGHISKKFLAENQEFAFTHFRDRLNVKSCLAIQKDNLFLLEKCNGVLQELRKLEILDQLDDYYSSGKYALGSS
jgi:polar amino acid transport system substrate-binding protein